MVFISKCDLENANYFKILEEMKIKFGSTVCPCVVPAKLDDGTPVYINLFSQKAFKYESGKQIQVELPDIGHRFQGLIEAMSEAIAETDDELMEKVLMEEEISVDELKAAIRKGVIACQINPVFVGSAYKNKGVQELLDAVVDYMPSPVDIPPIKGTNPDTGEEEERPADPKAPFASLAFKIMTDPYVGKLTYLRVYSGHLDAGSYVLNATKGKKERIGRLLQMHSNQRVDIDAVSAGDIVAVVGLKDTSTGDSLCAEDAPVILESMEFADPVIDIAVEPKTKAEQDKMAKTAHNKIFIAPPMQIDLEKFYTDLQTLKTAARHNDNDVVDILQEMVPTYHPNRRVRADHTVVAATGNTAIFSKEEVNRKLQGNKPAAKED